MTYRLARICLLLALVAAALPAHHSVSLYDMKMPITLTGVVTRMEWANPHGYIYLTVRNDQGQVEEWVIELESPGVLEHHGWTHDTVKPGDRIMCKGGRSKTGARSMKSESIELANGQKLKT